MIHGLLLDENLPRALAQALHQRDEFMAVRWVGDGMAPPLGTPDPDLLEWIASHEFVLVTDNRNSMPVHLGERLAGGRHVPGILQVPPDYQIGPLADEVLLQVGASLPGELEDRITHLVLATTE